MVGLLRTPATVAIYRTRRTCARPPQMQRLPRSFPLSRLNGARPARAAICLRLSIPSSGNCASRVLESTLPTPGTERSNSSRWVVTAIRTVSTDDAYVNGHVTFVAPRVPGQVVHVLVDDNNRVRKGNLLVQLDKEPYRVQVDIAQAALTVAQ